MDETIKSIILGIIQGLTEFLPVSSSGHLELGKVVLDLDLKTEESILLTVVLHFATALSTVVVFWKDILAIIKGILKFKWNENWEFVIKIGLSMIPAALVGVLLADQIDALFDRNLLLVGSMLILTAILLLLADRSRDTDQKVGWGHAIIVGIAQAIAILPGISRSGATISTSVLLGIDRAKAARFSFLMVIPLIFAKMAKDLLSGDLQTQSIPFVALFCGFIAAFITGLFACRWMIALVRKCQLRWFAYYCFIVGILALGYHLSGDKKPEPALESALVFPSSTELRTVLSDTH